MVDILPLESVVITVSQRVDTFCMRLDIVIDLLGRGDTCQQQHVVVGEILETTRSCLISRSCREDSLQLTIVECREVKLLIGIQIHLLGEHAEIHGFHVFRTFGHDDNVCAILTLQRFTQATCWYQLVEDDGSVVVNEQNVDTRLDIAVLEGVIEQNNVCLFRLVVMNQVIDTACTFAINGYRHLRIFLLDLIGLVANHLHLGVRRSQHIPAAFTFVASAKHSDVEQVFQQSDEVFHMGGLSCAANGDIANGDNGYSVGLALQDIHIKEQVPELHAQAVQPAQWQQLLI